MSIDNAKRQKVIATIQKLLALSRDAGATEAEAMSAAERAQAMLAAHNLEMSDLGTVETVIRDKDFLTDRAAWIKPVLHATAQLYFCGYYFETFPADWIKKNGLDKDNHPLLAGGHSRVFLRHNFIGKQGDIIIAKYMGEYFIDTIQDLCKQGEKTVPKDQRTSYRYSFMNACASRLATRLVAKRAETSAAGTKAGGTNLPALRPLYDQAQEAIEDFLKNAKTVLKEKKSLMRIHNVKGARDGFAKGNSIGLDQQVGNGKVSGMLGGA